MSNRIWPMLLLPLACSPPKEETVGQATSALVTDFVPNAYTTFYKIHEPERDRVLDVSLTSGEGNRVYGGGALNNQLNQEFLVLPFAKDSNWFYLVPHHRGGVVQVSWFTGNLYMSDDYPLTDGLYLYQLFQLEPSPSGYLYMRSIAFAGSVVDVSDTKRARNQLYVNTPVPNRLNQVFWFEEIGEPFLNPPPFDDGEGGPVPDPPKITSFSYVPPETTPPVTVSEARIPFVFVHDINREYQVRNTPYYRLVQKRYWRRLPSGFGDKPAHVHQAQSYVIVRGVEHTKSLEVQRTLKFNVKVDGALEFTSQVLKASLGASLEREIHVSTTLSDSFTETTENTQTSELQFPDELRVRWAAWSLIDKYSLQRLDGSEVLFWELAPDFPNVIDAYYGP